MFRCPSSAAFVRKVFASQLGQNVISNYFSTVWVGGLSLVLIPIYLKLLGPAQWGLVAACMSIQAFMSMLDMGLSQIMPRDMARASESEEKTARTFDLFARAYLLLGVCGFLIGELTISWVVKSWFHNGEHMGGDVMQAFRLVLIQFLFQFANNAHIGYWNGLQAQRLANIRQCIFATAKHVGSLTTIIFWSASAEAYLLPFAVVALLEFAINRKTITRHLRRAARPSFNDYRILAGEAGLLAVGVLIGMTVSQIDRFVLARVADITTFGRYVIVANLGIAFMQLQYPLVRAYFPRIVHAQAKGDKSSIRRMGVAILGFCIVPCMLVALFAPWILQVWTRDSVIVKEGVAPLRFILMAVAVNALYQLFYQQILSRGYASVILKINLCVLLAVTPTAFFAINMWGGAGAGFSWLVGALIQLCLGLLLSRKVSS